MTGHQRADARKAAAEKAGGAGGSVEAAVCDCAGRLIETNAHERHCAIYGPHEPVEQLAEALEKGVPEGPAAIHFCPWPGCADIWESEASCVHAQAIEHIRAAAYAEGKRDGAALGRRATLDPGAFVKRGPDNDGYPYGEDIGRWQTRAIEAAITAVVTP